MTPQQIEAMKMALEALKKGDYALVNAICEELKQAQPEQEPVAWLDPWTHSNVTTDYDAYGKHGIPLYITPPQRKPLTDEELEAMAEKHVTNCYFDTLKFARAIEAAHDIKGEA